MLSEMVTLLNENGSPYSSAVKLSVEHTEEDQLDIMVRLNGVSIAGICFSVNTEGKLIVSAWHTEDDGTEDDGVSSIRLGEDYRWVNETETEQSNAV